MTKQEINEYLAEHLFGLKRGVDFGRIEIEIKGFYDYKSAPDYTAKYMCVLEKLLENEYITIYFYKCQEKHFHCKLSYQDVNYFSKGDTIGESICLAAVEWLKAGENT